MVRRMYAATVLVAVLLGWGSVGALAHVPHDDVDALELSPAFSQDRTVFAIVRGTLFRSTDGGFAWTRLAGGLCADAQTFSTHMLTALALSPAFPDDRTLFAACHNGEVYRSQDAGRSWTRHGRRVGDRTVGHLVVSPSGEAGRAVWVLTEGGDLFRIVDGDASWEGVFGAEAHVTALAVEGGLLVVGTDTGGLYGSADGGVRWSLYGQHPRFRRITCIEVPAPFTRANTIYVGTEGEGVFRVRDGMFHPSGEGMDGIHVTALASAQREDRLELFASTWDGRVRRSVDAGATWTTHTDGLMTSKQAHSRRQPHFKRIVASDDGILFLGGFCGVFRSDDRGESWYTLETTLHHIVGLDVSPSSEAGYTVGITAYGGGAYSTPDGGGTWHVNNRGVASPRLGPIVYSPDYDEDRTLFTATFDRVLKSTDDGEHWSEALLVPPARSVAWLKTNVLRWMAERPLLRGLASSFTYFRETPDGFVFPLVLAISPTYSYDRTLFAGMLPNGVMRSLDGGTSFTLLWDSLGEPVKALEISPAFTRDRTLFASVESGIFRTRDGGRTWQRVYGDAELGEAVLAISPGYEQDGTLYAGGTSGLYRTRDAGETWEKLEEIEGPVSTLAISPNFVDDGTLLVQVKYGSLFLCRDAPDGVQVTRSKAVDLGYEFSQLIPRESSRLIQFSPNYGTDHTVYAASMNHLVRSTDGGMTWTEIPRPVRYESEASLFEWFFLPVYLDGSWEADHRAEYSNGTSIRSDQSQSAVQLRFVGTGVTWIGSRGPDRGRASVSIDGEPQATVDQYEERDTHAVALFSKDGLARGPHTITVTVEGARSEYSSGVRVDVDAFDVRR